MVIPQRSSRVCGDCTACCTAHQVEEWLNKPQGVKCPHVVDRGGCTIYTRGRPRCCELYSCCWLRGMGHESERPDLAGVIADVDAVPANGKQHSTLILTECEVDGFRKPFALTKTREALSSGIIVCHVSTMRGGTINKVHFPVSLADEVCRKIIAELERRKTRAVGPQGS